MVDPGSVPTINVPANATLNVPAGTVVKFRYVDKFPFGSNRGTLNVAGTLNVTGTANQPAVFTKFTDDAVGGDTNGDTNDPLYGYHFTGITVEPGGLATLRGVVLQYASTALNVAAGGNAEVHGKILNSAVGVASDEFVDATNVDWGDPSGPAPIGTGTPVTGSGVYVLPWVGFTEPPLASPVPAVTLPSQSTDPGTSGCKQIMYLGLRGSGEPPTDTRDDNAYTNWQEGFGPNVWKIENGFTPELNDAGITHKSIALRYTAFHVPLSNPSFPLDYTKWGAAFSSVAFMSSIAEGVARIDQYLNDEISHCSDQKYVLVGYSQGALAIHIFLNRASDEMLNRIAAVGLLADPAKNANPAEHLRTDDFTDAKGHNPEWSIVAAQGVYRLPRLSGSGPLKGSIADRTVSLCNNHDIVCAPGFSPAVFGDIHSHYAQGSQLTEMGAWLGRQAKEAWAPVE